LEERLKALYLKVEARLEFSEDGIPPLDVQRFKEEAEDVQKALEKLCESYAQGKVLREGLKVALVGPPNTGKSSLLNALLGIPRAIVTPQAGTTRDVVEGEFFLKGAKVRLFDTAGLRSTEDPIEKEGIRRSRQVIAEADLLLWLADATSPEGSLKGLEASGLPAERTWVLFNKKDLVQGHGPWGSRERSLGISCLTGEGLSEVLAIVGSFLTGPNPGQGILLTSLRHRREVAAAVESLARLAGLVEGGQPFELWAEELRSAALAVGRVRGRDLPASAFEEIFSKFCIGK
jgi:tRNA modification GTPase